VDDYRSNCVLWAVCLGADEFEARWALSWLDDQSLPGEVYEALVASLMEWSPAWAGQVIADIGGEEFRVMLSHRADCLIRERREARLDELQTMPYREYLRTPEWRERASVTYARFGWRCAVCNGGADLEAHHRTYDRRGVEEPGDLTALCPSCHGLFHEWRELAVPASLG
jgi:hypothetical protein